MSKLVQFPIPPTVRSSLLKNVPDMASIPPMDELELLNTDLHALLDFRGQVTKIAPANSRAVNDTMRRVKEKGKARAFEKPKRERDCT